MGPLSKVWMTIEEESNAFEGSEEPLSDEMLQQKKHIHNILLLFEYSLSLVAQTSNELLYQRRVNILSSFFQNGKKAKEHLKSNAIVNKDLSHLFGEEFEEFVTKNVNSKKKTKELIDLMGKKQGKQQSFNPKQPFSSGSLSSTRGRGRGRGLFYGRGNAGGGRGGSTTGKRGYYQQGKKKLISSSEYIASESLLQCTSIYNAPFSKSDSKCSFSRTPKVLLQKLGKIDKGSSDFINDEGSQSDKLKKPKQTHTLPAFQDGGVVFAEGYASSKRLYDKIGSERCLFFGTPRYTISKVCEFSVEEKIYQFLCMCFGLGPAPRLFTKLMKVPISLLRKPNRRLIVYLDDILIMGKSIQEIITARDTIIFLLQNLGFSINEKKSVLVPSQVMEFLGMKIDSTKMLLILPKEKVVSITSYCQKLLDQAQVSVREMSKLIGTLSSTALAVLPAPLHYRGLQNQNIQTLPKEGSYNSLLTLSSQGRLEIEWWIKNLALNNGRTLLKSSPELIIPPMPLLKVRGRGPLVTQREDHGQFKKKNFI